MNWNQPQRGGATAKPDVRQGVLRGKFRLAAVAAAALLCIAAFVTAYLAWPGGKDSRDGEGAIATRQRGTKEPSPRSDMMTGAQQPHKVEISTNATDRLSAATPAASARRLYRGVEVVSSSCSTNLDGAVVERLRLADGRLVKAVRLPEPAFRRPTDQLIAMAVSAEPGVAVPPPPIGPDAERGFMDSLSEPIEDLDSDTPEIRALKAKVREARAQIADVVRAGSSFREAMEAHVRESARMADARAEAARMAQEVLNEGGEDEARAFTERANALLEADGVPPIPVPGKGR